MVKVDGQFQGIVCCTDFIYVKKPARNGNMLSLHIMKPCLKDWSSIQLIAKKITITEKLLSLGMKRPFGSKYVFNFLHMDS